MLVKNELYRVTIEDVNDLGYGVCRIDSQVVFVALGVTGDTALVRIIKVAKTYAVARIEELITPSDLRVEPACDVFRRCGGCSLLHMTDAAEKELKEGFVKSALHKAGLDIPVRELLRGKNRTHYRNKAQYPLFCDKDGHIRAGFYARHSHAAICAEKCLLQPESFTEIATAFCKAFESAGLSCYNEEDGTGLLRHLNLREGADGSVTAEIVINATKAQKLIPLAREVFAKFEHLKGISANFNTEKTNVIRGRHYEVLCGEMTLTQNLCDKEFAHGPASFFQVNREAASLLFDEARRLLNAAPTDAVCDLYCGVGAVGQCVAPDSRIHGADVVREAIAFATQNATKNGCNAAYAAMDAADYFAAAGKFDAVLLDPPRAGLSDAMVDLLLNKKPKKILYISCNPATLARDLARLTAKDYETDGITPVDLFPKTGHVEAVVLLSRK